MLQGTIGRRTGVVEVHRAVVALLIGSRQGAYREFPYRRLDRPFKRIDGTHHQHRRLAVPTRLAQNFLAMFRRQRFKSPGGVSPQFRGHPQVHAGPYATPHCA